MTVNLNPELLQQQKCSDEEIEQIYYWHEQREGIFAEMQKLVDLEFKFPGYVEALKYYSVIVAAIEFQLQYYWRFELDHAKHSWWYQVPGCTCPKDANFRRYATGERVIDMYCIIHGKAD